MSRMSFELTTEFRGACANGRTLSGPASEASLALLAFNRAAAHNFPVETAGVATGSCPSGALMRHLGRA
jgi:hypothetical protein